MALLGALSIWGFLKAVEKQAIAHKLATWLLNITTTCMVSQHHLFKMFAKFPGLPTVNNFAKANGSVCVDLSVGKKFDVVATDEAALFFFFFFIKHCSCRNEQI